MRIGLLISAVITPLTIQLAHAESTGFYLGGGIGRSYLSFNGGDFGMQMPGIFSPVTRDTNYKFFGGYDFSKTWAVEAGYADLGAFRYNVNPILGGTYTKPYAANFNYNFNYKAESWFVDAKATLPVSERINLFGKLGATFNEATDYFSIRGPYFPPKGIPTQIIYPYADSSIFGYENSTASTNRLRLLSGVGAEYNATAHVSLRLEVEDYGESGDQNDTGRARLSIWSLGFIYKL